MTDAAVSRAAAAGASSRAGVRAGGLGIAAALLVVAVLLRAVALDRQSLWLDELLALWIGQQELGVLLERTRGVTGQSPLYYLFIRAWSDVFGRDSDLVVRALSVVLGALSLAQIYAFARRFLDTERATLTLALLALSPAHLYFSQEARMYPLLMVLFLAFTHLVLSAVRDPGARGLPRMAAIALLSAATMYTHYYAALFILAVDFFLLVSWPASRPVLPRLVLAQAAGAVLYVPWIPALLHAAGSGGNPFIRFVGLKGVYTAFVFSLGYSAVVLDADHKDEILQVFRAHAPLVAVAGIVFGFLTLRGLLWLWRRERQLFALVASILFLPVAISTVVSVKFPIISERYFTPALPFFGLVLACGLMDLKRSWRALAAAAVLALFAFSLGRYYFDDRFGHHDWKRATAWLEERRTPGETVLLHPAFIAYGFDHYRRGDAPTRGIDDAAAVAELRSDEGYFLFVTHPRPALDGIVSALDARFQRVDELWLPRGEGIRVLRYAPRR